MYISIFIFIFFWDRRLTAAIVGRLTAPALDVHKKMKHIKSPAFLLSVFICVICVSAKTCGVGSPAGQRVFCGATFVMKHVDTICEKCLPDSEECCTPKKCGDVCAGILCDDEKDGNLNL